MKLSSEWG